MHVDLTVVLLVIESKVAAFDVKDVFADVAFFQQECAFRDLPNGGVGANCT